MDRPNGVPPSAVAGATVIRPRAARATGRGRPDDLNVAVIGCGTAGRRLISEALFKRRPLDGLRFRAICDIWPHAQKYACCLL